MWGGATKRFFSVLTKAEGLEVHGLVEKPVLFRNFFLRDAAYGDGAIDPDSQQKVFTTGQLEANVHPESAAIDENGLSVKWNDGFRANYSKEWLSRYARKPSLYRRPQKWEPWRQLEVLKMSYQDYFGGGLQQAAQELDKHGLVILTDIPAGEGSPPTVKSLASRVGEYPKTTFYGTTWDVRNVPKAINVAYTAQPLTLHMDLLYYESPPGLQLLHCIENDAQGGESVYSDCLAAVLDVKSKDPEAYEALCTLPLTYHYVNDGKHYFREHPVVSFDTFGEIEQLNYSPPFQGPLNCLGPMSPYSVEQQTALIRGLRQVEAFVQDPANQIEFRMQPGTCAVFLNRRLLHARRAFDPSKARWLKGTYADIDAFNSLLRTLPSH